MTTNGKLLVVNIKLMRFLNLWLDENVPESKISRFLKDISILFFIFWAVFFLFRDLFIQIIIGYDDILDITENLIGIAPATGAIYVGICFILNRKTVKLLIRDLVVFEEFGAGQKMLETEKKAAFFTKAFIFYAIIGNIIYMAMPYINIDSCRQRRQNSQFSKHIPCELITRWRLPFQYDDKWYLHIFVCAQLILCSLVSFIILAITMFVVSLLMQLITQLQQLQEFIKRNHSVRDCIRYHIAIIDFSRKLKDAFNSIMLMFISVTSFEMSVLLFDVLMSDNVSDSLRYALHLCGWVILLFLPCFYGQKLIDESINVGWEVYSMNWYEKSISDQKDLTFMLKRSQKPLIVTAASMSVMSLETFLGVMSTAYSYFTLLVQIKE